ncbi:hypothetical protein MLD52_19125 [Puniceicoccaceae bacterium K14]|nr:hypothetical protein [Puniceicoccaceae bacterium K14]
MVSRESFDLAEAAKYFHAVISPTPITDFAISTCWFSLVFDLTSSRIGFSMAASSSFFQNLAKSLDRAMNGFGAVLQAVLFLGECRTQVVSSVEKGCDFLPDGVRWTVCLYGLLPGEAHYHAGVDRVCLRFLRSIVSELG